MDAKDAFKIARDYLIQDPILADWSSVQPIMILPSGDSWGVICEYKRMREDQKERAIVFIGAQSQVTGYAKI